MYSYFVAGITVEDIVVADLQSAFATVDWVDMDFVQTVVAAVATGIVVVAIVAYEFFVAALVAAVAALVIAAVVDYCCMHFEAQFD